MIRVALLMSALLACGRAHVYERCELARELTSLGVRKDHLATWVCIAYHESRFDTAARNHGSGDHGLFQISELYWCGSGKACGVPCTAFRDEDISNDLDCALKIHKEHTRLQGDGFLAWVVYPQHCKHINAKKYLVDCEASLKDVTVNLDAKSRSIKYEVSTPKPFDANYYAKHLPSFLAINSVFEGNQAKQLEGEEQNIDWVNFKIDDIDNIKLPMLNKNELIKYVTSPLTTTTTTAKYYNDNYSTQSSKIDWTKYKFDNIDSLKLPAVNTGSQQNNINNGLPNWLNIRIDNKLDDPSSPGAADLPHSSTPATLINYEENYLGKTYKNDWVNFKVDNIDDLKIPILNKNANQRNDGLPNWLDIKIDSKIDDIKLPVSNHAVVKYVPPSSTPTTFINYEENYLDQNYNHDWVNFKIDNIDDIKLPSLSDNIVNQRNRGLPSWLNVKIDSKIDKINMPTFEKLINTETSTRATTTTSTTIRTTTIDPELIGIKPPMPKRIESNQFRRKMMLMEAILGKLDVIDVKNMSVKADSQFALHINRSPEITTSKIQSTSTMTYNPVTSVATTTYTPIRSTLYTSIPTTTQSVFNFQWKSKLRANTSTKEITTQKNVFSQEKTTDTAVLSKQSNVDAGKTIIDSRLTTQSTYIVNKQNMNVNSTSKPAAVVTTTSILNKYPQERSTTSAALSTTTTQPTTTSRFSYSFPVIKTTAKPKTTTASSGNSSLDWKKRFQEFQERFTLKPFSWSAQKPTTSRPYLLSNLPTLKPFTFNTSNVLSLQNRSNVSKSTLLPVLSTSTKPYWSWSTSHSQSGLTNRTSTTLSSLYKPFSTTSAPYKALQDKLKSQSTTASPPGRRRWSFSFGTNANKPLESQTNTLPPVSARTATSTSRPFSTNKTDVFNISSESRKYSTFVNPSIKQVQEYSSTVKSIPVNVKSSTYNPYSSAKQQVVTKPTEKSGQLISSSTPSIFDLYLRPEKYHSVPQFQFPSRSFSANKLTIFSGGTTPPAANITLVKP